MRTLLIILSLFGVAFSTPVTLNKLAQSIRKYGQLVAGNLPDLSSELLDQPDSRAYLGVRGMIRAWHEALDVSHKAKFDVMCDLLRVWEDAVQKSAIGPLQRLDLLLDRAAWDVRRTALAGKLNAKPLSDAIGFLQAASDKMQPIFAGARGTGPLVVLAAKILAADGSRGALSAAEAVPQMPDVSPLSAEQSGVALEDEILLMRFAASCDNALLAVCETTAKRFEARVGGYALVMNLIVTLPQNRGPPSAALWPGWATQREILVRLLQSETTTNVVGAMSRPELVELLAFHLQLRKPLANAINNLTDESGGKHVLSKLRKQFPCRDGPSQYPLQYKWVSYYREPILGLLNYIVDQAKADKSLGRKLKAVADVLQALEPATPPPNPSTSYMWQ